MIKSLIDAAATVLHRVALSDLFYSTRQATPEFTVISTLRSESNDRADTFSYFKKGFHVTTKEREKEGKLRFGSQSEAYGILNFKRSKLMV